MVSLKTGDDTSSAKANKKAQVSVINQAQPQINVLSSRKSHKNPTEIPQADKAEWASEPSSRHEVGILLFLRHFHHLFSVALFSKMI